MRNKFYIILAFVALNLQLPAQQKWGLLRCVEYANANNLSIKQSDLQANLAQLQLNQIKMSQYPNASFSTGTSFNSGRNQNPVTYSLITQSYLSANMQLQTSATIFNFYSIKNNIAANEWSVEAAKANTDKLKNDISLTVANAYLQILLANAQENIAMVQLQQSQAQLSNTRKLVDAGSLPELNAAELEAQVARDSATFIAAKGSTAQNILVLKAYMSLDAATPFEVDIPPVDKIPVDKIGDLQPEDVYASAIAHLPQQRVNDFNLKAAEKSSLVAKSAMLPTLSAYGSLGTGYADYFNIPNYNPVVTGTASSGLKAIGPSGVLYDVITPTYTQVKNGTIKSDAFFSQFNQNFRQSIGISLSVPIFNSGNLKTNYLRSKINIQNLQLQQQVDNNSLKQNIYQAYNSSLVALEKYNAGKKSVESAERSYGFAKKRYDVGMLSTFELITNQNNLFTAKLQNVLNQYDYVFKMKVLEFYKGMGLKL